MSAARTALSEDPGISFNAIAKAAGVGQGTLYRHFPTRKALIVAVNAHEFSDLVDTARSLTDELSALDALRAWCGHLIDHMRRHTGLADALRAVLSDEDTRDAYRPVADALAHLMAVARTAGAITSEYDPTDLQMLLSFTTLVRTPDGERRARRLVELVVRGLAA